TENANEFESFGSFDATEPQSDTALDGNGDLFASSPEQIASQESAIEEIEEDADDEFNAFSETSELPEKSVFESFDAPAQSQDSAAILENDDAFFSMDGFEQFGSAQDLPTERESDTSSDGPNEFLFLDPAAQPGFWGDSNTDNNLPDGFSSGDEAANPSHLQTTSDDLGFGQPLMFADTEPFEANDADRALPGQPVSDSTDDGLGFSDFGEVESPNLELSGFNVVDENSSESDEAQFDGFGTFEALTEEPDGSEFAEDSGFAHDATANTAKVTGNLFETSILQMPMRGETSSIDSIADSLDREMLARAYNQAFTDNNILPEDREQNLKINELSFQYYVSQGGAQPYEMFEPVSFSLGFGSCCAVISDIPLASYALAREIADRYDSGDFESVSLAADSDGTPREVVYLGGDEMLPSGMTCREYLMISQGSIAANAAQREETVTTMLSQVGLGEMEDDPLIDLSHNKRMLILALSAAINPHVGMVIINDASFNIEGVEEQIALRVFALLCTNKKTTILSCCSPYLFGAVANHVLVFARGKKIFDGNYRAFIDRYCLGIMSFTTENPKETVEKINRDFRNVTALCKGSLVYLVKNGSGDIDLGGLLNVIESLNADRTSVVMDEKTFDVACKEVFSSL
ncbi:MAG: hypothetical protein RR244_03755, partial [Oscillospiraceae bacterium]